LFRRDQLLHELIPGRHQRNIRLAIHQLLGLQNLEHRLGTLLLQRGTPPQLTEAGLRLMRYVDATLNGEREALTDIARIKSGELSTLSLALSPAVNDTLGVELLKEFCTRNPVAAHRGQVPGVLAPVQIRRNCNCSITF